MRVIQNTFIFLCNTLLKWKRKHLLCSLTFFAYVTSRKPGGIIETVKKPEIRYLHFNFCIIITFTDNNHLQNFKYCVLCILCSAKENFSKY